ncbi:MAG: AAA family ATPase [Chitinispirillaceae bacterium]|nr:AAA family ATPase [Chitinispirillaceae bacterium]
MKEFLNTLIQNTKVTKDTIQTRITHPITGQKYPLRNFFVLLKKYATDFITNGNEPRMIGLVGLRGVGKTTLMWQLAEFIIKKFPHSPIYFFNVNEITISGYNLSQALNAFQTTLLKKRFNELTTPIILLFDEVHDAPDWVRALKILYDEAKTAFIVCTGSSALLLRQTADLARRIKIERLYPFRFIEFITAKSFFLHKGKNTILPQLQLAENLKEILFFSKDVVTLFTKVQKYQEEINSYFNKIEKNIEINIEVLLDEYIKYYNIPAFLLYKESSTILENIYDLFKRVVYEDISKINNSISDKLNTPTILNLLTHLAISDEINKDKLSKNTNIKKEYIENILDIIEKAELINILSPFGGPKTRLWENRKVFFMSPSLRLSLLSIIYGNNIPENLVGKLYEDIVVMYIRKTLKENQLLFVKNDPSQIPDFIIETGEQPIVVEVGKRKINTSQLKQINKRYGLLISSGLQKVTIENNTIKLPLKIFFLL